MELPEIATTEELNAMTPAEQLTYATGLAAKALELLEVARDSVTVPAGASGNAARAYYNSLVSSAQNLRYQLGLQS